MPDQPSFYITTPIYYVNARPHIGHAYTTVVADAIARRQRSLGVDTWFLTGTDEHGQKIERSARAANRSPQAFTDQVSTQFRSLWDRMGLSYDDYIRTTEPRHRRGVQKLFSLLKQRGYIYKGTYTGQYCVFDELYVDAPPGSPCPDCGRITETVSEENYFFKLSAFERRLLEVYEQQPDLIRPEARRNEVISFVRGGLKDLSISRTSFDWGIPVPGDEKHVIYVWMDALANYITALGYGSDDPADVARFARYWPANLHIIGKEISRFHCVYWPAFLLAAGLPLPKSIVAHGWLLFEESKMSKSRGNIVRTETILDAFGDALGADVLRYFLMREIVFGQDGSFSFDALVQRYNSDLANGYGNLVSRTLAMIARYFGGAVPEGSAEPRIIEAARNVICGCGERFTMLDFSRALDSLWSLVGAIDGYITEQAPWKLGALDDPASKAQLATILFTAAEAIRIITALLYPVMPDATAKVWRQLGLGDITAANLRDLSWGGLKPGTRLGELAPIFPRADKDIIDRMQELEKNNQQASPSAPAPSTASTDPRLPPVAPTIPAPPEPRVPHLREAKVGVSDQPHMPPSPQSSPALEPWAAQQQNAPASQARAVDPGSIARSAPQDHVTPGLEGRELHSSPDGRITIDDFSKVELRVAQIKVAERIPKADKLLRLEVDLGYETRQILAGIAEAYAPESLIGRKVVIVANLQPRKLRGLESNGMIVAASIGEKGSPVLAGFLEDVEIGARLK